MRKKFLIVLIPLLVILGGVILYISLKDNFKPSKESDIDGKDMTKEEYLYKEELLNLGYSIDEIKTIENKISNVDVKKYLLTKKINNLTDFIYSPVFNIENVYRYESYYAKNPTFSPDDAVVYVEIGLDNKFYTNIQTVKDYKNIDTLVNKYNILPNDFALDDLKTLAKPYSNDGTKKVREVIYDSLIKMISDAKKEKLNIFVVSGYRSYNYQKTLFNNSVKRNGKEHALLYSAKPGHSEHQLGLAVDLNETKKSFEKTNEYKWLKENSYKYGFIERYPKGKEFITGYTYEPWHYRYLGIDIATKLFEENITFEEYLVKYKK